MGEDGLTIQRKTKTVTTWLGVIPLEAFRWHHIPTGINGSWRKHREDALRDGQEFVRRLGSGTPDA